MTAISHSKGHEIIYKNNEWVYADTCESIKNSRLCKCENVGMGSYDNQEVVEFPWDDWTKKTAGIDKCILPTIKELWKAGIKTEASCCGHKVTIGNVIVSEGSIEKMKQLGYIQYVKDRPDIFMIEGNINA